MTEEYSYKTICQHGCGEMVTCYPERTDPFPHMCTGKPQKPYSALKDLELRIEELEKRTLYSTPMGPLPPVYPLDVTTPDCGCPVGYNCGSTACPRSMNITCSLTT